MIRRTNTHSAPSLIVLKHELQATHQKFKPSVEAGTLPMISSKNSRLSRETDSSYENGDKLFVPASPKAILDLLAQLWRNAKELHLGPGSN